MIRRQYDLWFCLYLHVCGYFAYLVIADRTSCVVLIAQNTVQSSILGPAKQLGLTDPANAAIHTNVG